MKNLTFADVYRELGLVDPDLFELRRIVENLSPPATAELGIRGALDAHHRHTGRTMRTKVEAVSHLSHGRPVILVADSAPYAKRLVDEVLTMARRLHVTARRATGPGPGLPPGPFILARTEADGPVARHRLPENTETLFNHYAGRLPRPLPAPDPENIPTTAPAKIKGGL